MRESLLKTDELFNEIISLPLEMRVQLVDKLLASLNPLQKDIDEIWAQEVEKRVENIRTGKVSTIPGEEVFKMPGHGCQKYS